jgi:Fur family peroxide stress response transcriptional regulator
MKSEHRAAPDRTTGEEPPKLLVRPLLSRLEAGGLRPTLQREQVLRALVEIGGQHPTAEELHRAVQARGVRVSLATVYNTLEALRQVGVVSDLGFSEKPTRYDLNLEPHTNLVCTACGRIEDLDTSSLSRMVRKKAEARGYQVVRERMDLYGLCPRCRRAAALAVRSRRRITNPSR